jgi:hypothetical protein
VLNYRYEMAALRHFVRGDLFQVKADDIRDQSRQDLQCHLTTYMFRLLSTCAVFYSDIRRLTVERYSYRVFSYENKS